MPLRDLIAAVRAALGLTQEDFARKLHVRSKTIFNWESGSFEPHPVALQRVAAMAPAELKEKILPFLPPHMRTWEKALMVPLGWWEIAESIGQRKGLDAETVLFQSLIAGLALPHPSSVPTSGKIDKHEEEHANVTARHLPGKQRKRKVG